MSFDEFTALVRRVLNKPKLVLTPDMKASQVPGWDSLQHVVLLMEIEAETGAEVTAEETADMPNLAALLDRISQRQERRNA